MVNKKISIKIGDVVKCTSHSRPMAVREVKGSNVITDYFVGGEYHSGFYPLQKITLCQGLLVK